MGQQTTQGDTPVAYRFTLARIVHAGPITAHAALDDWAHGQITVPVPALALTQISGLGSAVS
ncbi:hypothetical protein PV350_36095 [Streptomyces sp. PA03-6a]|nr:hypothetical protein [Streptomyces sp. PA03-6a]